MVGRVPRVGCQLRESEAQTWVPGPRGGGGAGARALRSSHAPSCLPGGQEAARAWEGGAQPLPGTQGRKSLRVWGKGLPACFVAWAGPWPPLRTCRYGGNPTTSSPQPQESGGLPIGQAHPLPFLESHVCVACCEEITRPTGRTQGPAGYLGLASDKRPGLTQPWGASLATPPDIPALPRPGLQLQTSWPLPLSRNTPCPAVPCCLGTSPACASHPCPPRPHPSLCLPPAWSSPRAPPALSPLWGPTSIRVLAGRR